MKEQAAQPNPKTPGTDFVSSATAQASGVSRRPTTSSVTSSLQCSSRFFMAVQTQTDIRAALTSVGQVNQLHRPLSAPARPSSVTCHVKQSPRRSSDSCSRSDTGNTQRQSRRRRERWCSTTAGPEHGHKRQTSRDTSVVVMTVQPLYPG